MATVPTKQLYEVEFTSECFAITSRRIVLAPDARAACWTFVWEARRVAGIKEDLGLLRFNLHIDGTAQAEYGVGAKRPRPAKAGDWIVVCSPVVPLDSSVLI